MNSEYLTRRAFLEKAALSVGATSSAAQHGPAFA